MTDTLPGVIIGTHRQPDDSISLRLFFQNRDTQTARQYYKPRFVFFKIGKVGKQGHNI